MSHAGEQDWVIQAMANRADRMVVFSDDWGRHPSSSQHMVRCMLDDFEVDWINTIGMRPPKISLSTMKRGFEKIGDWARRKKPSESVTTEPANPRVQNPIMWPRFCFGWERALNAKLLIRQLRRYEGARLGITTVPIVADIVERLDVDRWIYYCVDDWSNWVGLDHKTLAQMEARLLAKVDSVVTVSDSLKDRIKSLGYDSHLITHGVHREHWQTAGDVVCPGLEGLERPLVVQWGLMNQNLDVPALARLASELTSGTIVLVGPEVDVDPALDHVDRVVRLPAVDYAALPALASEASVLVMAYHANAATVASQPLKLKEYMSTPVPVIARRIPATDLWSDAVCLYDTPEEFSSLVRQGLKAGLSEGERFARERLETETWSAKAEDLLRVALRRDESHLDEVAEAS